MEAINLHGDFTIKYYQLKDVGGEEGWVGGWVSYSTGSSLPPHAALLMPISSFSCSVVTPHGLTVLAKSHM